MQTTLRQEGEGVVVGGLRPLPSVVLLFPVSRALAFLEGYISDHVLPWYGNTHTVTAAASRQMTLMREEARSIVRNAVHASEHDCVVFTGCGTTAAVNLLVHAMGLRPPGGNRDPPIVLHGPFEHHSNLLPWREIGAEVSMVLVAVQINAPSPLTFDP